MSPFLVLSILCLTIWTAVQGSIFEDGEVVIQNALRWNYSYMNPTCLGPAGGRNPCEDVRICRFATASLALGGWPTLCGWVGKGVPKVCCGLPLVLGPGLMKKVDEETSRKMECGTRIRSTGLSETQNSFFKILDSLPEVDISDPDDFDPPLDLEVNSMLIPPVYFTGSRQGDFPWMVSIRLNGSHVCGGSLIDRNHVLTAARCVLEKPDQYAVHIGNLYVDDGYVMHVDEISVHPQYKLGSSKNLAIVTLKEEILSPYVPNICLPGADSFEEDIEQYVSLLRWGMSTRNHTSRLRLHIIEDLTIIPVEECQLVYSNEILPEDLDDFICTKRNQSETSRCEDDYGGPLMYKLDSANQMDDTAPLTMIGVDTFGAMCESKNNLKLYTRVSRSLDWISKIINK